MARSRLEQLSEIGREAELVVLRDGHMLTKHALIGRLEDFAAEAAPAAAP